MVVRVASFFPFQTTYYLNGHSFIEQELKRAGIGFRKDDNDFLAVDNGFVLVCGWRGRPEFGFELGRRFVAERRADFSRPCASRSSSPT